MKKIDEKKWILKNTSTNELIVCRGDNTYKQVTVWKEEKYNEYKYRLCKCDLKWLIESSRNLNWHDSNYEIFEEKE